MIFAFSRHFGKTLGQNLAHELTERLFARPEPPPPPPSPSFAQFALENIELIQKIGETVAKVFLKLEDLTKPRTQKTQPPGAAEDSRSFEDKFIDTVAALDERLLVLGKNLTYIAAHLKTIEERLVKLETNGSN